ncbi:unnamed protein product [Mycena citricolor]|uniref:Uncharacterized protein n=1 Tax=Mycena citricolor TaxID=2018698 RepID=A0AAD2Q7H3_9AGAR|nr:unnamed protein product [Mycena citricolor]
MLLYAKTEIVSHCTLRHQMPRAAFINSDLAPNSLAFRTRHRHLAAGTRHGALYSSDMTRMCRQGCDVGRAASPHAFIVTNSRSPAQTLGGILVGPEMSLAGTGRTWNWSAVRMGRCRRNMMRLDISFLWARKAMRLLRSSLTKDGHDSSAHD